MIRDESSQIYRDVDFGMQAESFLDSPVGKYLIARAEGEVEAAVEELKTVDCTDAKAIQTLQNRVYRAESIQYWLAEAIQAGLNAQDELLDQST